MYFADSYRLWVITSYTVLEHQPSDSNAYGGLAYGDFRRRVYKLGDIRQL